MSYQVGGYIMEIIRPVTVNTAYVGMLARIAVKAGFRAANVQLLNDVILYEEFQIAVNRSQANFGQSLTHNPV